MKVIIESVPGELIKFQTKDGLELHGFLHKTKANNKRIIIHIHGMSGNFYASTLQMELAEGLNGTQYDLFSPNTRGSGLINRFQTKTGKKTIGTAFEKFAECILDIDAAIKTAKEKGYKEIILSGQSTGCQKIVYYQAKKQNPLVKGLVLLAPADDYNYQIFSMGKNYEPMIQAAKKMVAKGKGNEQLFLYENQYSANRWLSTGDAKQIESQIFNYSGKLNNFSKITIPILAMFGSKEKYTDRPVSKSLEVLREKTKSKQLITVEIEGADHQFHGFEDEAIKNIIAFLEMIK